MSKKYVFETAVTPLAAFIKAKYQAEIEFSSKVKIEENGQKRVIFIFESDTLDFTNIESVFLSSFANTFHNELMTLKNIVRTLTYNK
jgi:hypothetical protein